VVALLCAPAFASLAARMNGARARLGLWGGVALLTMIELTGAPFLRWEYEAPAYYEELARDDSIQTVLELPAMDIDTANARYNFFQVEHRKKQPLGYCTTLARSERNIENMQAVVNSYFVFMVQRSNPNLLAGWTRKYGIDLVVLHRTWAHDRLAEGSEVGVDARIDDRTIWAPFFFTRTPLVRGRQMGRYVDQEIPGFEYRRQARLLEKVYGKPIHEDDELTVFRVAED